jgi:pSer/pThr/pTyr-binding forkhead associated (FHA) protein
MSRDSAWLVDQRWFKAYPLRETTTIGRGIESTIILREADVSRTHAKVKKVDDSYVLEVYGASGTKVNGAPISAATPLHEGDVVEIAFTSLQFTHHAPTTEMLVVPQDAPTLRSSQEGPTRATLHAVRRTPLFGQLGGWRWLWRWLTRRTKTD